MLTACASESRITAPQAYAPTERLDGFANEETAKKKARERVQADVDRMMAERVKGQSLAVSPASGAERLQRRPVRIDATARGEFNPASFAKLKTDPRARRVERSFRRFHPC